MAQVTFSADAGIFGSFGPNFTATFAGQSIATKPAPVYVPVTLTSNLTNSQVLALLAQKTTTLADVATVLNSNDARLLKNGYANLFMVLFKNSVAYAIGALWSGSKWNMIMLPDDSAGPWSRGSVIFTL